MDGLLRRLPLFMLAFVLVGGTGSVFALADGAAARATVAHGTAAAGAAGGTATPVTVGIHDGAINNCDRYETQTTAPTAKQYAEAGSSFNDPRFMALNVQTVRVSMPWDIADPILDPTRAGRKVLIVEQACLDAWLQAANVHHLTPEIAFKPDYNDVFHVKSGWRIAMPTLSQYEQAISAFRDKYIACNPAVAGQGVCGTWAPVTILSPWGEPDFSSPKAAGLFHAPQRFYLADRKHLFGRAACPTRPTITNCGPKLAAQLWVVVEHRVVQGVGHAPKCGGCIVIAGDFSSGGGLNGYLTTYTHNLRDLAGGHQTYHPAVWGVHPYTDIVTIENFYSHLRPKPRLARTLVGRFAAALHHLSPRWYNQRTSIWLNEITVFYQYGLSVPSATNHPKRHPTWSRAIQADAARYLLSTLADAGGRTTRGEPVVRRLYYLPYTNLKWWALVVGTTFTRSGQLSGGKTVPAYAVFAHRRTTQ